MNLNINKDKINLNNSKKLSFLFGVDKFSIFGTIINQFYNINFFYAYLGLIFCLTILMGPLLLALFFCPNDCGIMHIVIVILSVSIFSILKYKAVKLLYN